MGGTGSEPGVMVRACPRGQGLSGREGEVGRDEGSRAMVEV
jgi:hypothetical protein